MYSVYTQRLEETPRIADLRPGTVFEWGGEQYVRASHTGRDHEEQVAHCFCPKRLKTVTFSTSARATKILGSVTFVF